MKTTYAIEIDARPSQVFYWLDDPDRVMKWVSNLVENEELHQTANRIGSTFRQVVDENGRRLELQGSVTGYEPDQRLAVHLQGKDFELDVDYRLEELAGRTRLTQHSQVRFRGLMKPMGLLMRPFFRKAALKQLDQNFAKLKDLCESRAEK